LEYDIFGIHQLLFLGNPQDDFISTLISREALSLASRLEVLLKTTLSEDHRYYLSRLLISLVSGLVPTLQTIDRNKKENVHQ
jgi:hypothetical protein